ncbi:MAG TPA: hypothetical protein VGC10_06525 [Sphingomonas sp.]
MSRPLGFLPADRALMALLRALAPHLGRHRLIASTSRDWASATFEGARHRLALVLEGEDAAARAGGLQATLGETDLPIPGGFVADIGVVALLTDGEPAVGIEALTIVEAPPPDVALSRAARRAG